MRYSTPEVFIARILDSSFCIGSNYYKWLIYFIHYPKHFQQPFKNYLKEWVKEYY